MRNTTHGFGHKAITIYDISKLARVSPATVSRVISGSARVSEEKKQAVLLAMKISGFTPNVLAQSLAGSGSHTIGFIVPDIKNPYFSSIYYHVELLASQNGYAVLLANSRGILQNESQILSTLTSRHADAIVFMGGRIDSCLCGKKELLELEQTDQFVPLLLTSRVQESSLPQIYSCEEGTLYALMQHLKEQGCKTFAILGGSGDVRVAHQRKKLLLMYGHQVGMESRPEWDITDTSFSIEGGKQAATELLEASELPDAACCLNDMVAVGALQQFRSKGIQIPQDILLTGFDGEFLSDIAYPGITTAEFDYKDFAQQMFDLLLKRIHHEPCAQITEIYPHLTIRGSTTR